MTKDLVFGLIGGLGFFLYGMKIMSDGLKRVAGDRLKSILNALTSYPVVGVLLGTGLTCLIQSSSSMTVIVVGLVNAGLLTLRQAIGVILGANIGTTFTAWLVSFLAVFKISTYAMPAVGVGFLMTVLGKNRRIRHWGEILLGFGILFVGLDFMKDSFKPLGKSAFIENGLVMFAEYPILGVLFGIVVTSILQSSSATIALLQIMALNGVITFEMALPVILGDNIGTTVTAQLASIGGNINARRTSMAHTIFNVVGTLYMLVFVYNGIYPKFIEWLVPGELGITNVMIHIALAHSVFNIFNTFVVFLPAISLLEKLTIWLVPEKKGDVESSAPRYLEEHLLDSPPLAFDQARNEMVYMATIARKAVRDSVSGFLKGDTTVIKKTRERETVTDNLQRSISEYIIALSRRQLEPRESEGIPVLLHSINDIERMGDLAVNITELTERKVENNLKFDTESENEMNRIYGTLNTMINKTITAFKDNNIELANEALACEKEINNMQVTFRNSYSSRLNKGTCDMNAGIIFVDFVDNIEKIGDHVSNIAQSIIMNMRWDGIHQDIDEQESDKKHT